MLKQAIYFIYNNIHSERLDNFLASQTGESRSFIQNNIKSQNIQINNKIIVKTGFTLKNKDIISGYLMRPETEILPSEIPLNVVFEDEYLLVINKQSDLIVHPTTHIRENTLVNGLLHKYQQQSLSSQNTDRAGIVHRLDKDTTGLMIIAKNDIVHRHLSEQLKDRSLSRIYWAIIIGNIPEEEGQIIAPIGRSLSDRKKMAVLQNTKNKVRYAETHWKVLERFNKYTLLELKLKTGRTHQIRVHLEYINYPILGDPIYGGKKTQTKLIQRQALHAKEISFIHPINNNTLHFVSELPKDFADILSKLKG